MNFAKNTGLLIIAVLAILAAGLGIGMVLEAISWNEFTDLMTKAVLVGIIVVAATGIVGAIMGAAQKK